MHDSPLAARRQVPKNIGEKWDIIETKEEKAARKEAEKKALNDGVHDMHTWYCGQDGNAELYLCQAFRDFQNGVPPEEMDARRPDPNPAAEQMQAMHKVYCKISAHFDTMPCQFFRARFKDDLKEL